MVMTFSVCKPCKLLRGNVLEQARHQRPSMIKCIRLSKNCVGCHFFCPQFHSHISGIDKSKSSARETTLEH